MGDRKASELKINSGRKSVFGKFWNKVQICKYQHNGRSLIKRWGLVLRYQFNSKSAPCPKTLKTPPMDTIAKLGRMHPVIISPKLSLDGYHNAKRPPFLLRLTYNAVPSNFLPKHPHKPNTVTPCSLHSNRLGGAKMNCLGNMRIVKLISGSHSAQGTSTKSRNLHDPSTSMTSHFYTINSVALLPSTDSVASSFVRVAQFSDFSGRRCRTTCSCAHSFIWPRDIAAHVGSR